MSNPQFLYMCEAEGIDSTISTRQAKINAVIKEVRAYPMPTMESNIFAHILKKHGIYDLTEAEFQEIENDIK